MRRCVGWALDADGRFELKDVGLGRKRMVTRRAKLRMERDMVIEKSKRRRGMR
jgi:hypothetical protein